LILGNPSDEYNPKGYTKLIFFIVMEKTTEQLEGWADDDNIEMDVDSGYMSRTEIRKCINSYDGYWSGRYFIWTTPSYRDEEGGCSGGEEDREGFDYQYVILDECAKCEGKQDNMERWSCYTLCTECSDKVAEFILE